MKPPWGRWARHLVAALAFLSILAGCAPRGTHRVRVGMRYSRFTPASFAVAAGTIVRLDLVNDDPISHEFVIGDEAAQQRHETGKQKSHDGEAGAASLEPGERQTIWYRFPARGTALFGCHKPGHYAYGMRGTITIT